MPGSLSKHYSIPSDMHDYNVYISRIKNMPFDEVLWGASIHNKFICVIFFQTSFSLSIEKST